MTEESLPLNPKDAVRKIKVKRIKTDLMGTARQAIRTTLWLGAHFGYQLRGAPMGMRLTDELREKFLKKIDIVLAALSEYDAHYPELSELDLEDVWELDPATSNFSPEEILAIDYRHLRLFLHVTGLRNEEPPATS